MAYDLLAIENDVYRFVSILTFPLPEALASVSLTLSGYYILLTYPTKLMIYTAKISGTVIAISYLITYSLAHVMSTP